MLEREGASGESKEGESKPVFSLIIPTRNEIDNIQPLSTRLIPSLRGYQSEVIFVDDSDDNTPDVIRNIAWSMPMQVVTRERGQRRGGLSTAVMGGIGRSSGQYIGVMDADLQHPPEVIPTMLRTAQENDDDILIASRYTEGGSMEGLANPARRLGSKGTIFLYHKVFPKLKGVTDPSSGFFIVNRRILEEAELHPQGFKMLLEILVNTNWVKLHEVPYEFDKRLYGESKMGAQVGLDLFSHMYKLWRRKNKRIKTEN